MGQPWFPPVVQENNVPFSLKKHPSLGNKLCGYLNNDDERG